MSNRLIILNTDGSTPDGLQGIFDAQFKEEIIIEENSEIALQSTLINRNINFLELGQFNNEITCRINTDGDSKVSFPVGTYTKTNLLSFMKQAQNSLNKKLKLYMTDTGGTVRAVGRKINFLIDASEKVNITYKQEPVIRYEKKSDTITNDDWIINENGALNFKGGTGGDNQGGYFTADNPEAVLENYGVSRHYFSKGCGVLRAKIALHNNTDDSIPAGMLIGLVSIDLVDKVNNGTLVLNDISYGIRTNTNFKNEQVFQVKTPDSATWVDTTLTASDNSTFASLTNDVLFIRLDEGKIKLGVVKHPAAGSGGSVLAIALSSTDYDFGTTDDEKSYMPIVCVFGDESTSRLTKLSSTLDSDTTENLDRIQNYNTELTEYTSTDFSVASLAVVGQTGTVKLAVRFDFPTIDMANFFGYNSQIQSSVDTNVDFQYEANNKISILLSTSTYLIELLNLSVDSYHSGEKGRKNILSSVPVIEDNLGLIQYEPVNLIYVALNNKYKQTIRNLRARIITNEFSTISTQGTSELNLLIRKQK